MVFFAFRSFVMVRNLITILLILFVATSHFAQTPPKKHKDFGSSLKRLQWDPIKKEVVTAEPVKTQNADEDIDVIRVETSLVAWEVLVVDDKGNNIRGLTGDDFVVTENDQPQTVGYFLLGDNKTVPRRVVLVIDYSGSQLPYIRNSIDAAKLLVDKLSPQDRMAIVTDDVELLVDFTTDKNLLKKKLESLFKKTRWHNNFFLGESRTLGKSEQYSALLATLSEMFENNDQRQIIVFQTDGDQVYRLRDPIIPPALPPDLPEETRDFAEANLARRIQELENARAPFSLADIYRATEKSRATIYTVIPGIKLVGLPEQERIKRVQTQFQTARNEILAKADARVKERVEAGDLRWRTFSPANMQARATEAYKVQLALAALSLRTGGWTDFLETPQQASAIYSRIFDDINQRYTIGYYPTNKDHDGKRRTISVTIKNHPEYVIVGRRSYYAPKD
jgi:VWFA-related protein